jgi:hypothetical protein
MEKIGAKGEKTETWVRQASKILMVSFKKWKK